MLFRKDILKIDCEAESRRLEGFILEHVRGMRRDGAVIGLSGGVDSAVSASLCVRALGKERVHGLILPERDSNPVSAAYGLELAKKLGIGTEQIDITPILEGFGTYEKRDRIIRDIIPGYDASHKLKITLPPDLLARDAFNVFTLTVTDMAGKTQTARLEKEALNGIVAATNTKHRARMMELYYAAERLNCLVCGTTNRPESLQGFFVKYGDGGVDIEPLAHLYKTQVYQLARHLGVIEEIINRAPSPDTFSFVVSDEEFFFRMPYAALDLLLFAWEHKIPLGTVAEVMGLTEEQVKRSFRDFDGKFSASAHVRRFPPSPGEP